MAVITVGAYQAKTHLPRLLAEVENGGEVVVTKHGRPIARIVPVEQPEPSRAEVLARIAALRGTVAPLDVSIRELIDEGRRY